MKALFLSIGFWSWLVMSFKTIPLKFTKSSKERKLYFNEMYLAG